MVETATYTQGVMEHEHQDNADKKPKAILAWTPRSNGLKWAQKHQIGIASSLICGVIALHLLPSSSQNHTQKFMHLSYKSRTDENYKQGFDDIYFVTAWVVIFTALRAISIEWLLRPMAAFLNVSYKSHQRFAEQSWLVIYYGTFWSLGMYIWINSPYWLDNDAIWNTWPASEMSGTFKWYNLVQLAFWIQQIFVVHVEKRRKDHAQMLTHHIITCTLISVSYIYRYTRVANVVLCLMDIVDLLFPIAKILRYSQHEKACNIAFGLFVITWFIARHVMYLQLCYSIYTSVPGPNTMQYGCYSGTTYERVDEIPAHPDYFSHLIWPFLDAEGPLCLNVEVKWIFLGMLGFLQTLSLIWFAMILKVIAGMLTGKSAEDTRSEDESEVEETWKDNSQLSKRARQPIGMTDLNICVSGGSMEDDETRPVIVSSKPRPTNTRRRPGVLEKEILARIGCEKPQ